MGRLWGGFGEGGGRLGEALGRLWAALGRVDLTPGRRDEAGIINALALFPQPRSGSEAHALLKTRPIASWRR